MIQILYMCHRYQTTKRIISEKIQNIDVYSNYLIVLNIEIEDQKCEDNKTTTTRQ